MLVRASRRGRKNGLRKRAAGPIATGVASARARARLRAMVSLSVPFGTRRRDTEDQYDIDVACPIHQCWVCLEWVHGAFAADGACLRRQISAACVQTTPRHGSASSVVSIAARWEDTWVKTFGRDWRVTVASVPSWQVAIAL